MSQFRENAKHYIAAGTELEGKVNTEDNIVIDGKIIGTIEGHQEVRLDAKGSVVGPVRAKNIIVKGKIRGDIFSNGTVEILPGGVLEGNITTPLGGIVVQPGGILNSHLKPYRSGPERTDRLPVKKKNEILSK